MATLERHIRYAVVNTKNCFEKKPSLSDIFFGKHGILGMHYVLFRLANS